MQHSEMKLGLMVDLCGELTALDLHQGPEVSGIQDQLEPKEKVSAFYLVWEHKGMG